MFGSKTSEFRCHKGNTSEQIAFYILHCERYHVAAPTCPTKGMHFQCYQCVVYTIFFQLHLSDKVLWDYEPPWMWTSISDACTKLFNAYDCFVSLTTLWLWLFCSCVKVTWNVAGKLYCEQKNQQENFTLIKKWQYHFWLLSDSQSKNLMALIRFVSLFEKYSTNNRLVLLWLLFQVKSLWIILAMQNAIYYPRIVKKSLSQIKFVFFS